MTMATIGLLFAPLSPFPVEHDSQWFETVHAWMDAASWEWFQLWKQLPETERAGVPRTIDTASLSSAMANPALKKNPPISTTAPEWARQLWEKWRASGAKTPPVITAAEACASLGIPSRMSLQALTGYAGGWSALAEKKLKRGGTYAVLRTDGDPNGLGFVEADSVERAMFVELARAYGGEALAAWTFGGVLQVLVAQSPAPGSPVVLHGPFSVRMRSPAGARARTGFVDALRGVLQGSIHPDFDALAAELARPRLSVAAGFAALGIPGAPDSESVDTAALWGDVESIGRALLAGGVPEKAALARVKKALAPVDPDVKIPGKGKVGTGATARTVANFIAALETSLGMPKDGPWALRQKTARTWWDILDGEAGARLTVPKRSSQTGLAASVARVLTHFPEELARDPIFLSLLALTCEAANSHAYVDGLQDLAEAAATAGLLIVAVPAAQHDALRTALGIEAVEEPAKAQGHWGGEAFLTGTAMTKTDPAIALRQWMEKGKSTGVVAVLPAVGEPVVEYWHEGKPTTDRAITGLAGPSGDLTTCARALDARTAFRALGAGDVLETGAWHEGSYGGAGAPGTDDHLAKKRRFATALLASLPTPSPLPSPEALVSVLGPRLRYSGPLHENDGGIVSFRIVSPVEDPDWMREVRNDLQGRRLVDRYGAVWTDGTGVRGYTCSTLNTRTLATVLADAPSGTEIALGRGNDMLGAWKVA